VQLFALKGYFGHDIRIPLMSTKSSSTTRDIIRLLGHARIQPVYYLIPMALAALAALFEGVGVTLLIPLLNGFLTMDYKFLLEIPGFENVLAFWPAGIQLRDRNLFLFLIGFFVLLIVLRNVLKYVSSVMFSYLTLRALHHLRKTLFGRYLSFGKLFFDRTSVGHHGTVLADFAQQAFFPLIKLGSIMNAFFSLCAYAAVMFFISWQLTLMAVPLFLILHFSMHFIVKRVRTESRTLTERSKDLGKKVIEILAAMPLVQMNNAERAEREHYSRISDEQAALQHRIFALQQFVVPLQEVIILLGALSLLIGMSYLLIARGESTPSSFLVYFYVVMNAGTKLGVFTEFWSQIARAAGPVEAINAVLEDEGKERVADGREPFTGLNTGIEFRSLTFAYTEAKEVLKGFSLTIPKGKMTALVGATGSGKSTVVQLLTRFYDVPPASLFVDGRDIREFSTATLRDHMALVSQDTQLFHESLRYNITYGMENIDEATLQRVIKQSRLAEFIAQLPNGLDTLIGDRGVQLSGGERQRVAIARALLKDAEILILDEATSALDSRTETLIQEAIDEAVRGRTTIVIAHRLSTIRNADNIAVLEEGRLMEQGTFDKLIRNKGSFARFWEAQQFA
jgi:subfamily B ATP-binding cassette protein MsbA